MSIQQTGLFYLNHDAGVVALREFPREFRSSALQHFDSRFVMLFAGLLLVVGGVVVTLSFRKPSDLVSDKQILKIQERYASIVLNQPRPKVVEKEKVAPTASSKGGEVSDTKEARKVDREKETFVQRQERRQGGATERRAERAQVGKQIRNLGIFAAITAASGSGRTGSSSVTDFLGAASGAIGDLGGVNISKGTFASRSDVRPEDLKGGRGTRTTGVDIQRESVGRVAGSQIAASASVNITSKAPEIKDESGGQASTTNRSCIQGIVQRESSRLKRVYENWLKRDPALNGLLEIKFTISTSGTVASVGVHRSMTNNTSFDENIVRYIERWDFSSCSIESSIEVIYPFVFEGDAGAAQ